MILKDTHTECKSCEYLRVWSTHKNGERDLYCHTSDPRFISKDLHREPCEAYQKKGEGMMEPEGKT